MTEEQLSELRRKSEMEFEEMMELIGGNDNKEAVMLPQCLKIGHKIFKVRQLFSDDEGLYMDEEDEYVDSLTMLREQTINVADDLSYESTIEAVIHQTLHAIEHVYKFEIGEDVVEKLSSALTGVILDNGLDPESIITNVLDTLDDVESAEEN